MLGEQAGGAFYRPPRVPRLCSTTPSVPGGTRAWVEGPKFWTEEAVPAQHRSYQRPSSAGRSPGGLGRPPRDVPREPGLWQRICSISSGAPCQKVPRCHGDGLGGDKHRAWVWAVCIARKLAGLHPSALPPPRGARSSIQSGLLPPPGAGSSAGSTETLPKLVRCWAGRGWGTAAGLPLPTAREVDVIRWSRRPHACPDPRGSHGDLPRGEVSPPPLSQRQPEGNRGWPRRQHRGAGRDAGRSRGV